MAQADTDFDWTTAQPVEEDETSATLTATTFGQRSMPVPTQGPVNIDTEFDWKTATLDEPFDPATAQPISEQEEQQFYQDLEVASRDPQRILTNTEHSLLYDHRQQQDDAVARFFQGAEDVPGNLLSLGMDAGTELRENWFENMFRPDRFAARNLATGMEIGRKAGVQLLQLVNWGQNKVADTIQRGNANDAKMREIAAAVPKTGDERVDGDNVMAAIARARDEGVFEETPFGPDKEQDYERYLRQNSYARSHAGNITEATMGGKTMTFPNEQTTVFGQQPMQAVSTIGAIGLDITSALPMGAGIFSKLRVLRRLSRVTGMPLPAVERGLAGVADGMEDFGSRVAARVTDKTGLSKTQQVASLAAVSGGAGLLAANTDGMDGVLLPVAAVSGIVPAYKLVGGTIRKTSQAAGTSAMVLREMRAGNIGAVRQAAADDLLRTGTVPPQYAAYMRPYANGVESTLGRVAKNPDNPEITRKLARLADGSGVTQAVRFADDAVSSGIAATLASTPFALLAPDAEQSGAIVGGAATLGTLAGPFAGAFGRSSSRKDADIARMLIDVHAVNGDVPALISLGRDRLGQIAGMQGVVAGKTDFVTLRASDYRANVDVRATGNETGAGVFIEKASNGTARIFINVGEPASMDGKVRVRDRGDGVREVRVRGNDGRTEFIAAPKGRRLLVNDGDTVKAGQQVVDYMPPSRSMPHEIAHAILTSDILDGDIRTDMRNYVTQVYGEDGIKARGREYMAQIVDGDIMFGTHEGAVALTPEEIADVRSGKRTMSDVMKGKPVEAAERDALIDARIDEYNQRSREKGGNDYDWARDEVTAEQFAGEAKGIDFRGIRAGGPKVLESALATSARVLEVLGAKFDRTTGKPLDNPSVLFRDNPLFQSPVLRKRMIEHVRAYNDLLAGLEDAGKRETRGTKVSVDGTPDSAARSPHTKMRPDPDKGGQVGNEFLYVDETGKTQWRSPSEVRTREGSRTSQANTMYNPSRILAPNSTEFGRRTTDSGRTIVSGPTLPAQFDHFVHFPKWMREFARVLEASRERGMTFIADYNAIGDGKDGVYRVRNRGDIRAIQREVAFVGWELTGNKHLKTVLMDLNAFRASAMKAINNGELGIFNNDMQVIEADLRTYLGNHRNGLPGEAGIGQAKRDMLNGLIGTGTAVQRKANPLFSDLNPRGSVRSFRLDRYNDLTPTGREGLSFDYDKINNNRMPQQIPRSARGMPDVAADAGGGATTGEPRTNVVRNRTNAGQTVTNRVETATNAVATAEPTVKPPKKLYRGEAPNQWDPNVRGMGTFALGKGLYSTTDKKFAGMYGEVKQVSPEEYWPRNPLVLPGTGDAAGLLVTYIARNTNFRNMREFNAAYPDPGQFVREQGFDGIIAGNEVVKYVDEAQGMPDVAPRGQAMPDAALADAPPFYMKSAQVLDSKIQGKAATADQVRAILKNPQNGIKAEELKWTGIEQAVERIAKENGGKVPKEALLRYLQEDGAVRLEEVTMADAATQKEMRLKRFRESQKIMRDAGIFVDVSSIGEVFLRDTYAGPSNVDPKSLPENLKRQYEIMSDNAADDLAAERAEPRFGQYQIPGGENYREVNLVMPATAEWQGFPGAHRYSGGPEDLKRIAHMRLNDRTDAAGKPGLFLEEIQSDRHQAGREKGYIDEFQNRREKLRNKPTPLTDAEMAELGDLNSRQLAGVPDAPFRKDWPVQMFKRALADAVGSGKDWIGWTTGETQAARYDLSKQIDRLTVTEDRNIVGSYRVQAFKDGSGAIDKTVKGEELPDVIGKDLAQKAMDNIQESRQRAKPDYSTTLTGIDLKVGGEGMKGFYDQILPKEISKYVKQWGGQVEKGNTTSSFPTFLTENNGKWQWLDENREPFGKAFPSKAAAEEYKASGASKATPIWRVNITPQMRESIKKAGQALFVGGAAAVVAEEEL